MLVSSYYTCTCTLDTEAKVSRLLKTLIYAKSTRRRNVRVYKCLNYSRDCMYSGNLRTGYVRATAGSHAHYMLQYVQSHDHDHGHSVAAEGS